MADPFDLTQYKTSLLKSFSFAPEAISFSDLPTVMRVIKNAIEMRQAAIQIGYLVPQGAFVNVAIGNITTPSGVKANLENMQNALRQLVIAEIDTDTTGAFDLSDYANFTVNNRDNTAIEPCGFFNDINGYYYRGFTSFLGDQRTDLLSVPEIEGYLRLVDYVDAVVPIINEIITVLNGLRFFHGKMFFGYESDNSCVDGEVGCEGPPPTGACCINNDDGTISCRIETQTACDDLGGLYQGDDSTCNTSPCNPPTGACCKPLTANCSIENYQECRNLSGNYQGDGTRCEDVDCVFEPDPESDIRTGACCYRNNGSITCRQKTRLDCTSLNGEFKGFNSNCPQVCGGKCRDSDDDICCTNKLAHECSGEFEAGLECPSPLGACCKDGSCFNENSCKCATRGGLWIEDASCDSNPCNLTLGACCKNGNCTVETEANCTIIGGIYKGDNSPCTDTLCNGVCCRSNGTCENTTETSCNGGGDQYFPNVRNCDSNPCHGACCRGEACTYESKYSCEDTPGEGTFRGYGTDCASLPCNEPSGACCLVNYRFRSLETTINDYFVYALAVDGNGDLIAGGSFNTAGGTSAIGIARWNGTSWSAMGTGISGSVYALAILPNGDLIAGGWFTTAGGVTANRIARWNGTSWSAMGTGMSGTVWTLAVLPSGDLIAGGEFTTAGGVTANNIARWNGTSWSALGTGMNSGVYALAVDGNGDLIAGGWFTTAGGVTANNIARWNGTSWSAMGTGMDAGVSALAVDLYGVIAGGWFTTAGGVTANRIARWNGTSWSAMGTGMDMLVKALAVLPNGDLIAGGEFTTAGSVTANRIARWNGTSWSALGTGMNSLMNSTVYALSVYDGGLIAGGEFTIAGGVTANYIARISWFTACRQRTNTDCTQNGGDYKGDNTTCDSNTCNPTGPTITGACCYINRFLQQGVCESKNQVECNALLGTFNRNLSCVQVTCNFGNPCDHGCRYLYGTEACYAAQNDDSGCCSYFTTAQSTPTLSDNYNDIWLIPEFEISDDRLLFSYIEFSSDLENTIVEFWGYSRDDPPRFKKLSSHDIRIGGVITFRLTYCAWYRIYERDYDNIRIRIYHLTNETAIVKVCDRFAAVRCDQPPDDRCYDPEATGQTTRGRCIYSGLRPCCCDSRAENTGRDSRGLNCSGGQRIIEDDEFGDRVVDITYECASCPANVCKCIPCCGNKRDLMDRPYCNYRPECGRPKGIPTPTICTLCPTPGDLTITSPTVSPPVVIGNIESSLGDFSATISVIDDL